MTRITVDLVDTVTPLIEERVHSAARGLPHLKYADLRLEVTEAKGAGAENGTPKFSGDDQTLAIGIRVLAGHRMSAPGYVGLTLGVADIPNLPRIVDEALEQAYRRAMVNGEMKVDARAMDLAEMVRYAVDVSRQVGAVDGAVKYNYVGTLTELSRELFVSSEGARIDQSFALTQGTCALVTVHGEVSQDLY